MAKFNSKVFADNENSQKECGIYLQGCLSEDDYEKLHKGWESVGGFSAIPFWKYCFENINVFYSNEELIHSVGGCCCYECKNINTEECIAAFYSEDDGRYWTPDEIKFCGCEKR